MKMVGLFLASAALLLSLCLVGHGVAQPSVISPTGLSPGASSTCSLKDLFVDPACMYSLTNRAKAGDVQGVDALTAGILTCLGFNSSTQVLRALTYDVSTPEADLKKYFDTTFTGIVQSLSGVQIQLDVLSPLQTATSALDTTQLSLGYYAMWILEPHLIPNLQAQGRLEMLDTYIAGSPSVDWNGVHSTYKTMAITNGSIAGLPLGGSNFFLYYRADILSAYNMSIPATWDDMLFAARVLNGSDFNNDTRSDYALCLQVAGDFCNLNQIALITSIMAQHTQVKGNTTGWLFDPDTLDSFVNTEAMNKTLRLISDLLRYSWPTTACYDISPDMWAGRCAMTISSDATFKQIGMRRAPNPWRGRGRIMMTPVPGSHEVLDRQTGRLVDCTSLDLCPYATLQYSLALNRTVLVNSAPGIMNSGLIMMNTYCPSVFKSTAAQIVTLLAVTQSSMQFFFTAGIPVALTRYKQLQADPRSLSAWQTQGFNTTDVIQYLRLVNRTLDHPNFSPDPRAINTYLFRDDLTRAVVMLANQTKPQDVHSWLIRRFAANFAQTPKRQFAESLWAGYNLQRVWVDPPPPTLPPMPPAPPTSQAGSPSVSTGQIIAIVVPCATVVLLLVMGAVWALRHGWMRRGPSGPPEPQLFAWLFDEAGLKAFCVVYPLRAAQTDVEGSAELWESLPGPAMDRATRLHHSLIRKLLAKHYGYESATEGYAFIMGFHTARQAVQFACDLQQQLMTQPWPEEVLKFHVSAPVWAQAVVPMQSEASMASQACSIVLTCVLAGAFVQPQATPSVESTTATNPIYRMPSTKGDTDQNELGTKDTKSAKTANSTQARLNLAIPRLESSETGHTVFTAQDSLSSQWQVVATAGEPPAAGVQAYRGLRLRIGIHTGLTSENVIVNKDTDEVQYTGNALALAKAVADSGQGGMTLLSLAAFEAWKHESAGARRSVRLRWGSSKEAKTSTSKGHDSLLIIHMGCYAFNKAPDIEPCAVYWAVLRDLECRLALGRTTLRNTEQLAAGVLQAPIGSASVVFCTMVGYSTLLAWDKELAQDALAQYNKLANALLSTPGGARSTTTDCSGQYLLEQADGLNLAVFGSPAAAIMWGLRMIEEMKEIDWPEELLSHELCESVAVAVNGQGAMSGTVCLFYGPRVKVGIDTGAVTCDVSPATARLAYRGRPMNRAARVVDKVPSGQVWCTAETVAQAGLTADSPLLRTEEVGTFTLKGLSQPLTLYQCDLGLGPSELPGNQSRLGRRLSIRASSVASRGTSAILKLALAGASASGPSASAKSSDFKLKSNQPEEDLVCDRISTESQQVASTGSMRSPMLLGHSFVKQSQDKSPRGNEPGPTT